MIFKKFNIKQNLMAEAVEAADKIFDTTKPYQELMLNYRCALKEVETKFEVLNDEMSVKYNRNPVENIKTRLKTPQSILKKLQKKDLAPTLENIQNNIFDVAGVRIVCSFVDDIYDLADMFLRQDDITLIEMKDYIKNPKDSGYRSLHVIVEIPIFLSQKTEHIKVEVQFRTIAMDFWASLEHKLRYKKKDINDSKALSKELYECSNKIFELDMEMQEIKDKINR